MKTMPLPHDKQPIFVLIFIVCLPTLVGVLYQLLH